MSLYAGDMSSRILGGEKIEDVLKNPNVDGGGARPIAIGFVPPTIKNTNDVSKLNNLENYLYTPSEIAIVRKNNIVYQKEGFDKQYKSSLKDAIKISALALSVPVLLALYVDKKSFSTNKSTLIIVSPLAISLLLMAVAPKWS